MDPDAQVTLAPECFVCTDSEPMPWRSDCRCTDRYVHDVCLRTMLERGAAPRCPVCLAPYGNVSYEVHREFNACSPGVGMCALSCACITLSGCAWSTLYTVTVRGNFLSNDVVVLLAASGFGMLILAVCTLTILVRIAWRIDNRALANECLLMKRVYHVRPPNPQTMV